MKQNDKILFESQRTINKSAIFILLLFIAGLIYVEFTLAQPLFLDKTTLNNNSGAQIKVTSEQWEIIEKSLKTRDSAGLKEFNKVISEAVDKEQKRIEASRNGNTNIVTIIFMVLFLLLILFFVKKLYDRYSKYHETLFLTDKGFIFKDLKKEEYLNFEEIEKIVFLGKMNIVGLLSNKTENVIFFKLYNDAQDSYIIANKGTFKNICDLLALLKENHPDKLVFNPIKENPTKKIKALFIGLLLGIYIFIREYDENLAYALLFSLAFIIPAIYGFMKDEKNECEELYIYND